jgi:hypothetical protein
MKAINSLLKVNGVFAAYCIGVCKAAIGVDNSSMENFLLFETIVCG